MAGALDVKHAEQAARRERQGAKRDMSEPENKMDTAPNGNKVRRPFPATKPSDKPELAGVKFQSAPARKQAEELGFTASDFSEQARREGVTTRDIRRAAEARGSR